MRHVTQMTKKGRFWAFFRLFANLFMHSASPIDCICPSEKTEKSRVFRSFGMNNILFGRVARIRHVGSFHSLVGHLTLATLIHRGTTVSLPISTNGKAIADSLPRFFSLDLSIASPSHGQTVSRFAPKVMSEDPTRLVRVGESGWTAKGAVQRLFFRSPGWPPPEAAAWSSEGAFASAVDRHSGPARVNRFADSVVRGCWLAAARGPRTCRSSVPAAAVEFTELARNADSSFG